MAARKSRRGASGAARGEEGRPAPPSAGGGELLDVDQAVAALGTSRPTFYRWLRAGKLKGLKVGLQWRFHREDIERFLHGRPPRIDLPADVGPLLRGLREQLERLGEPVPAPTEGRDGAREAILLMVRLAVARRAGELHLAPHSVGRDRPRTAVLRLRVDGVLQVVTELDPRLLPALVDQWKVLASCDLHERARPQDGRARLEPEEAGSAVELLVATLPTCLGEAVTVRLLDPEQVGRHLSLDALGFSTGARARLTRALDARSGLVVVTGPTGCGKSSTLYACLGHLAGPGVQAVTIEDPVECILPWAVQVPVRPESGLTFLSALKAARRADPDVLLVGEIRDRETLEAALKSALVGHRVLTALHADDAAAALTRIAEMGVEPILVRDAVRLVVSQRLVRVPCPACSVEEAPSAEGLELARRLARDGGLEWERIAPRFRRTAGCGSCADTGFEGRTAIAESLQVSPAIGELLRGGARADELRALAVREGMTTLSADGVRRATEGRTTLDEVARVLGSRAAPGGSAGGRVTG
jgi:excisionase family DNA binding protein